MTHGGEKSDPAIVAGKPTNKAASAVAESVERRAGPEGNAEQQSTDRAQYRTFTCHRRWDAYGVLLPISTPSLPKGGAVCGNSARTDLCRGRPVMGVPTANTRQTDGYSLIA